MHASRKLHAPGRAYVSVYHSIVHPFTSRSFVVSPGERHSVCQEERHQGLQDASRRLPRCRRTGAARQGQDSRRVGEHGTVPTLRRRLFLSLCVPCSVIIFAPLRDPLISVHQYLSIVDDHGEPVWSNDRHLMHPPSMEREVCVGVLVCVQVPPFPPRQREVARLVDAGL